MTISLLAPDLSGRLRRSAPAALMPMVLPLADVAGLTTACLLTSTSRWEASVYACAVLVLLVADGQHRLRICRRVADQLPRTIAVAATPLLLVLPWVGAGGGLALLLRCAAALVTVRVGVCTGLKIAHRRGWWHEPALVVGTGTTAVRVARLLHDHPEFGLAPQGFLDTRPAERPAGLPLLGEPAELAGLVARHGIQRVIVCFPADRDSDLVPVLRACQGLPVDVCVVPRLYELGAALPRGYLDELGDIPLIPLRRLGHSRLGAAAKATFDVVGAVALLVALAPVLLALAITVRLDGGGPALFRQTRVTRGGKTMELLKLRSMIDHADSDTRWVVLPEQTTRLGRWQLGWWLRTSHLDELPQLVNVLRGEMSLVGPRPERPYFAARFSQQVPRYNDRHRMRSGVTGWAQVNGLHGDTSVTQRCRMDNFYIEHWSPWMDAVILVRTLCTAAGQSLGGRK
ncbi:MAG: exopolysaccharide biosynthesis polyprenyl glycosylphosphotransferase [Actinomycetota bacterium]|nr:exopolysaccharide biosynthesis polyprenyl glycosylphosphotransferase [Actinomycetota bacterium]